MVEVGLTIRIAAALVFGWASVEKARQRVRFARSVEKHGIPNLISGAFGTSIIIAEAAVSAILLASVFLPGLSQIAAIGSGVLSIGFVGFVVHAIRTSVQEPCFCFGIQETRPANTSTLVRALAMLGSSVAMWVLPARSPQGSEFLGFITIALGLATLMFLQDSIAVARDFLREPATMVMQPTRRISVRHIPLTTSLFAAGAGVAPSRAPLAPEPVRR